MTHDYLISIALRWLKRPESGKGPGCQLALAEVGGLFGGERCDAYGYRWGYGCGSVVVEAKVSRSDFLADTKIFSTLIDEYKSRGKNRMGQSLRATWIDMFKEAQHAGEVAPGFNPAAATKSPRVKVARLRLDLSEWWQIFHKAEGKPYLQNGMLLALLTAQRPTDLCEMKFSDVWDDHLHIAQSKTGAKLALPLSLRLEQLGTSLGEVIERCRGTGRSKYILHYTIRGKKYGTQVKPTVMSVMFANARDATGINWKDGAPPSFYEQRSLSERLYYQQGIDTKVLLGHKHQRMTDLYHDDRGKEWTKLVI